MFYKNTLVSLILEMEGLRPPLALMRKLSLVSNLLVHQLATASSVISIQPTETPQYFRMLNRSTTADGGAPTQLTGETFLLLAVGFTHAWVSP